MQRLALGPPACCCEGFVHLPFSLTVSHWFFWERRIVRHKGQEVWRVIDVAFIASVGLKTRSQQPSPLFSAMVLASSGSLTVADLATAAGAGPGISKYLELRGIKAVGSLALTAGDDDAFQRHLLQPLLDGFKKGAESVTLEDGEKAIAEAVLRHMWQEARMWWAQRQANMTVTSSPGASSSATPGAGTPAVTSATAADKIPKTLPAGVWSQQVNKFNAEKLRGRDRSFPEEMLLGAEVVLARMWHEHHVTKMYTPTSLGEILAKRSFTATGEVNMLAKNPKKSNVLTIEDEQLVQEDEKVWSPRSVLSIMDGIEAVVWAWILLEIGEEHHCQAFGKWCISMISEA